MDETRRYHNRWELVRMSQVLPKLRPSMIRKKNYIIAIDKIQASNWQSQRKGLKYIGHGFGTKLPQKLGSFRFLFEVCIHGQFHTILSIWKCNLGFFLFALSLWWRITYLWNISMEIWHWSELNNIRNK